MQMIEKFKDMLDFGISLKLSGPDEDRYYCQRLRFFIMELEDLDADSEDDEVVSIWFRNENVLNVKIESSTLTFHPVTDASYEAIMVVLNFVSTMHDIVQEDFKRLEEDYEDFKPTPDLEDEEDDSDDFEWI